MEIKNSLSPSEKVVSPKGIKKAKQEFKNDADINSIMKKFQKTGIITHVNKHQGQYGDMSPQTLHESLNTVRTAETMFNELPSSIRNKFENQPGQFLEYVQDPKNYADAKAIGLRLSDQAEQAALAAIEEAGLTQDSRTGSAPQSTSEGTSETQNTAGEAGGS